MIYFRLRFVLIVYLCSLNPVSRAAVYEKNRSLMMRTTPPLEVPKFLGTSQEPQQTGQNDQGQKPQASAASKPESHPPNSNPNPSQAGTTAPSEATSKQPSDKPAPQARELFWRRGVTSGRSMTGTTTSHSGHFKPRDNGMHVDIRSSGYNSYLRRRSYHDLEDGTAFDLL